MDLSMVLSFMFGNIYFLFVSIVAEVPGIVRFLNSKPKQNSGTVKTAPLSDFFIVSVLVNTDNFFFVVRTTSLAHSVRHHELSTFAEIHKVWSTHLPICSSFISSGFGRFILWTD